MARLLGVNVAENPDPAYTESFVTEKLEKAYGHRVQLYIKYRNPDNLGVDNAKGRPEYEVCHIRDNPSHRWVVKKDLATKLE